MYEIHQGKRWECDPTLRKTYATGRGPSANSASKCILSFHVDFYMESMITFLYYCVHKTTNIIAWEMDRHRAECIKTK